MKKNTEKLIQIITSPNYGDEQYDAIMELGSNKNDEKAIDFLLKLLKHDNIRVVNAAAVSLSYVHNDKFIPYILDALELAAKRKSCGTLIYSIRDLNYINYLPDIVKYFSLENFEVNEMITLLIEKIEPNKISNKIKEEIISKLEILLIKGLDDLTSDYVEDCIEYLTGNIPSSP
jgi:hypothetical protein